jgi:ornithine cyclodeaminase/alanine dehydrogenase-like protein (mu-crystallin family)
MPVQFRLLTENDVKAVLSIDDLVETMASALGRFSAGTVQQPVRTVIEVAGDEAFCALMPAYVPSESLGAKFVTVFGGNNDRGLPSHLASIMLLDHETGALRALLDGRLITEMRTAAVSAVSSRLLARPGAASLAIIGSGVQARSHLRTLVRVHTLRHVSVWSPNRAQLDQFVADMRAELESDPGTDPKSDPGTELRSDPGTDPESDPGTGLRSDPGSDPGTDVGTDPRPSRRSQAAPRIAAVSHAGEAIVGADLVVLVTSSPTPVVESGWVKPGAHVISVGACRPTQREMDPALVARARLFVDSRAAALVESGDVVLGIQEGRFGPDHIIAEIGDLVNGATGRKSPTDITVFKSLGLAVEDVMAADLAYRRAVERRIGQELSL